MRTSASRDTASSTATKSGERSQAASRKPPGAQLPEMAPPADLVALQCKMQAGSNTSPGATLASIASQGFRGAATTLPNIDRIQASFGKHDVSHVQAYTDDHAQRASEAIRAEAYTMGDRVAFRGTPTLHTAAHEAAHVVQQRRGVHLSGGMGKKGDEYERQADDVANAVVHGRSAEPLLDRMVASRASGGGDKAAIQKAPPKFEKAFASTSIGVESELSGLVCALPTSAVREFAYVKLVDGNLPLVLVTKDMETNSYTHPMVQDQQAKPKEKWTCHTMELVTYPSAKSDETAIANRNLAVQFMLKVLAARIATNPHEALESVTSEDGLFRLVVTNPKHKIAPGTGQLVDERGSVSMTKEAQQATMGVKASAFGTGADADLQLVEAAPWFNTDYANDPSVQALRPKNPEDESAASDVDDIGRVKTAYAYLRSIAGFIAHLAKEYNLPIGEYIPQEKSKAKGLTDSKVKNEWKILPRTKPLNILNPLAGRDKTAVRRLLAASAADEALPQGLWAAVKTYVLTGGEVAGHGINDATVGGDDALLFEFRTIPGPLEHLVPKEPPKGPVEDPLKTFRGPKRMRLLEQLNEFVATNAEEFKEWYVATFNKFDTKTAAYIADKATAVQKAAWVKAAHAESWTEWTTG